MIVKLSRIRDLITQKKLKSIDYTWGRINKKGQNGIIQTSQYREVGYFIFHFMEVVQKGSNKYYRVSLFAGNKWVVLDI